MAKNKRNIKVAFPHMGTISIAWAAGLRKIGVEPFVPPYTSKKTLFEKESKRLPWAAYSVLLQSLFKRNT